MKKMIMAALCCLSFFSLQSFELINHSSQANRRSLVNVVESCGDISNSPQGPTQAQINWATINKAILGLMFYCPCIKYETTHQIIQGDHGPEARYLTCAKVFYYTEQQECSCIDDTP